MGEFGLTKTERLTNREEFEAVRRFGIRYHTRGFIIIIAPNQWGIRRLGVSVSRKIGGAVQRNRVKRLVREFFRLNKQRLPESSDVVFIARSGATQQDFSALSAEMTQFFQRFSAL